MLFDSLVEQFYLLFYAIHTHFWRSKSRIITNYHHFCCSLPTTKWLLHRHQATFATCDTCNTTISNWKRNVHATSDKFTNANVFWFYFSYLYYVHTNRFNIFTLAFELRLYLRLDFYSEQNRTGDDVGHTRTSVQPKRLNPFLRKIENDCRKIE